MSVTKNVEIHKGLQTETESIEEVLVCHRENNEGVASAVLGKGRQRDRES